MKEKEVKVLNIDKKKIIQIISRFGAKIIFDSEIKTTFFDFADARISKAKNVLRLRQAGQRSLLTFKKILSKQSAKEAEEYEVEVSDLQAMKKILKSLGLSETGNIQKHRTSYRLNNVQFDIDIHENELSYIPPYLEIEAENIDLIYKYAELLGYNAKDCLPWSTEDVINHYSTKRKVNLTQEDMSRN
jgi:predicted adenylyl cyclase CyaB